METSTSCKRSICEEQSLLQELTHRVNNDFAAAIGIVSLTAANSTQHEVKVALAALEERLRNYVLVQRCLDPPSDDTLADASAQLRRLCRLISRSRLECSDIDLLLVECPLQMESDRCWYLGMIISELISNSSRHAFTKGSGTIRVVLSQDGSYVTCCVADNGTAPADIWPDRGFKIVKALAVRLQGTIEQQCGPRGTVSVLTFPLSRG